MRPGRAHPGYVVDDDCADECLLPSQLFDAAVPETPERRLWVRVLVDACRRALGANHVPRREQDADYAWIMVDGPVIFGSFVYICEMVEVAPDPIRHYIAAEYRAGRRWAFGHGMGGPRERTRGRRDRRVAAG